MQIISYSKRTIHNAPDCIPCNPVAEASAVTPDYFLKKYLLVLMLAILWFFTGYAHAGFSGTKPLSADKAFALSVVVDGPNQLTAHWQVAQGYYLYSEKINFAFQPKLIADIRLPKGEIRQDLSHGEYEVYTGNVDVPVMLNTQAKQVQVTIDYQGCSEKGFCYPPMHKSYEPRYGFLCTAAQPMAKILIWLLLCKHLLHLHLFIPC